MKQKVNVANPLDMLNTVGEEIEKIFIAKGKDAAELLPIEKLRAKTKFTEKEIERICELLESGDELGIFIRNFQTDYENEIVRGKAAYKKAKNAFTKLRGIIPLLRDEYNDGRDRLDDILDFFDVNSEEEVFSMSDNFAALFREQNNVAVDPINLYAWLRRGELDFKLLNLPKYNDRGLRQWINDEHWRNHLESADYFKGLPEKFATFGVALILVPYLPKTVYGCVRWFGGNPLIQISDRNRDLATCWFTLFHELGHVLLHRNEDIFEGQINESKKAISKIEREANKFANEYLFNGDHLRKTVFERKRNGLFMNADGLASEFSVNPIFSAYWLLKAQYQPTFQRHIPIDFLSQY